MIIISISQKKLPDPKAQKMIKISFEERFIIFIIHYPAVCASEHQTRAHRRPAAQKIPSIYLIKIHRLIIQLLSSLVHVTTMYQINFIIIIIVIVLYRNT
jgi:hypothetical protein